jgi:hypothetical protein
MVKTVHVFTGRFTNRDAARRYTEAQWEPEPGESASDEEYVAWENRNPVWPMKIDLGVYLDGDFIETIDGDRRYDYLKEMLLDGQAINRIKATAGSGSNILVLIFDEALGGFKSEVKSTPSLTYCGQFDCELGRE